MVDGRLSQVLLVVEPMLRAHDKDLLAATQAAREHSSKSYRSHWGFTFLSGSCDDVIDPRADRLHLRDIDYSRSIMCVDAFIDTLLHFTVLFNLSFI